MLDNLTVVDLSAPLGVSTVLWPGEEPISAEVLGTHEAQGSFSRRVCLPEHAGTHLDAPVHYDARGADVSALPASRLVRPAVVLDICERAEADPDASLETGDVERFEQEFGAIPAGSAVLLRTGWDARRDDPVRYRGGMGADLHFPGFGLRASRLLVGRGVAGLGIDTLSIDPGSAVDTPVHREVSLPAGLWHLENLVGLDRLPPTGAWIVAGVPRVTGASGFPTRALALVP